MSRTLGLLLVALSAALSGCYAPTPATSAPPPPTTSSTPTAQGAGDIKDAGGDRPLAELSRSELGQKMSAGQQRGFELIQQNKLEEGYKSFQDSGKYARELRRRFPESSPLEKAVLGAAFYNEACALAVGGNPAAAFAALKEALSAGFADFDQLDADADLATVRALPEFEAWRTELDALAAAHAKEEVRGQIAAFQSYPFDFTLPDLDDKPVKLADLKGKVVIVDIWGTWCPPCRAEIPSFVKLQSKYGAQGLQIVGLGYERGDKEEAVKLTRDFMQEHNMNYICLLGDEVTQKQVPNFEGFPTTLFIDRTGKVRLQFVGLHPYATLEAAATMLLEEPGT